MKILIKKKKKKGFINNNNKHLIDKIEKLAWGGNFDEIIATKFINHPESQYCRYIDWNKMKRSGLSELAVSLPENANILEKETYGLKDRMFMGGQFKLGRKIFDSSDTEVYIVGTDYDACVLAIGYQFFDHRFQPHFILDCVGSAAQTPSFSKLQFAKLCERIFGDRSIIKKLNR